MNFVFTADLESIENIFFWPCLTIIKYLSTYMILASS